MVWESVIIPSKHLKGIFGDCILVTYKLMWSNHLSGFSDCLLEVL
mgnify:CR=1 FL=1